MSSFPDRFDRVAANMPKLSTPVLTVDAAKIHKVDTANTQSLHGMWLGRSPLKYESMFGNTDVDSLLEMCGLHGRRPAVRESYLASMDA